MKKDIIEFFRLGIYRPTTCQGSGRYSKNYTAAGWEKNIFGEVSVLKGLGLIRGRHYLCGNDAPKGGKCGDFVKLTAAGKRLAMVRKVRAEK